MTDDKTLVERLRRECPPHYPDTTISVQRVGDLRVMLDRIETLTAEVVAAYDLTRMAHAELAVKAARIEALEKDRQERAKVCADAVAQFAAQTKRIEALEGALRDAEAQLACVRPQKAAVACARLTINQALD